MAGWRLRFGALALLATSACDCGESPSSEAPDLSFLIGEGVFEEDAGERVEAGISETGPVDLGLLDAETPDLAGPDLGPPDAGDPCLAPIETSLDVLEAVRLAADLDGRVVGITGTATVGTIRCTELECEGGGVCCNTCRGPLLLDGVLPVLPSPCTETATVGCVGGACEPLVCTPPLLDLPARYEGRLRSGPDLPTLELFRFRP